DNGNTVVVVEHDEDTMRAADLIVDFGPGPGVRGGHIVAQGTADTLARHAKSLTGQYLSGAQRTELDGQPSSPGEPALRALGAEEYHHEQLVVDIPRGWFVCLTGVSGSRKRTLVTGKIVATLRRHLNGAIGQPGKHKAIEGLDRL